MAGLRSHICCNRASTRPLSGVKGRVMPIRRARFPHSALAAAFALKGETERAAAELAEAQKLNYDFYRSLTGLRARYSEVPEIRALFEATYGAGLRKAGMPEE